MVPASASAPVTDINALSCKNGPTVEHVVLQCPIHQPHCLINLTVLDDETIEWLLNTCPEV